MYCGILEAAIIIKHKECLVLIHLNTLRTESSFEKSLIDLILNTSLTLIQDFAVKVKEYLM